MFAYHGFLELFKKIKDIYIYVVDENLITNALK